MGRNLEDFGGREVTLPTAGISGSMKGWNFGWIPDYARTGEVAEAAGAMEESVGDLVIHYGGPREEKAFLWQFTKAVNGGKHFKPVRQRSGCCVGAGGGQAVWYLEAVEVARLGQAEVPTMPFWLLPYGRSRYYGGLRGRGEGSFGSAFAKAISTDGIVASDDDGLPPINNEDGVGYSKSEELLWSDGAAISESWLTRSRKHLVRSVAKCRTRTDVRDALVNGYPCTCASSWGGNMKGVVTGSPAVLLNWHADTWQHQMSIVGWWDHPGLGELFYIMNQWGPFTHMPGSLQANPDDSPPGGFWVRGADMDFIVSAGETFAFSQFDGFPAQFINWRV